MSQHVIELTVNGSPCRADVPSRRLLSDLLRDDLHLTGAKRGCETGVCGACSVMLDGRLVKSCLMLAVQAQGCRVDTVEGLAPEGGVHPLQDSFMRCGGLQCGYCTPGMLMAACAVLKDNPRPTAQQVRAGLDGNLCRCTGYEGIVDAILDATEKNDGN